MMKRWVFLYVVWVISVFCTWGEEGSMDSIRMQVIASIQNGTQSNQVAILSEELTQRLIKSPRLTQQKLIEASAMADMIRLMRLTDSVSIQEETVHWILDDLDRLHLIVGTILPSDYMVECFSIMDQLVLHDPVGRDRYSKLILSFSVVWDRAQRPFMHWQMGEDLLPYEPDLTGRYDYFKALYEGPEAKMSYDSLGIEELIFVVETPVPLSELEWARENEDGPLKEWGAKFDDIVYDSSRLSAQQYDWPWGEYKLSSIKQRGGICVDQAYYCVMTARAYGIPAIYFCAAGKSSGHAWFSFMDKPRSWVLDVGRYQSEGYTTGFAINPQTNKKMTDHDITYICDRSKHIKKVRQARAYLTISEALVDDPKNVIRYARSARKLAPKYVRPWQLEMDFLIAEQDVRGLVDLSGEHQKVFKDHPDIMMDFAETVDAYLRSAGYQEEADQLGRHLARKVDDDRDDLARFIGQDNIQALVDCGEIKKARREMEDLLEDHVQEGLKAFSLVRYYLEITNESDQTRSASRFLEDYIEEMIESANFLAVCEQEALEMLRTGYLQDGNEKKAQEVTERLRYF